MRKALFIIGFPFRLPIAAIVILIHLFILGPGHGLRKELKAILFGF